MSLNLNHDNVGKVRESDGHVHNEQIVHFRPEDEIDTLEDELLEETISMNRVDAVRHALERLRRISFREKEEVRIDSFCSCVGYIIKADNIKLRAYGMAFCAGLDELQGFTMTQVAAELMVTKAAISKVAIKAATALNIPRSRYMKSKKASEAYRERQLELNRKKTTHE